MQARLSLVNERDYSTANPVRRGGSWTSLIISKVSIRWQCSQHLGGCQSSEWQQRLFLGTGSGILRNGDRQAVGLPESLHIPHNRRPVVALLLYTTGDTSVYGLKPIDREVNSLLPPVFGHNFRVLPYIVKALLLQALGDFPGGSSRVDWAGTARLCTVVGRRSRLSWLFSSDRSSDPMPVQDLKSLTRAQLADLARRRGIADWRTLKKDALLKKLRRLQSAPAKPASRKPAPRKPAAAKSPSRKAAASTAAPRKPSTPPKPARRTAVASPPPAASRSSTAKTAKSKSKLTPRAAPPARSRKSAARNGHSPAASPPAMVLTTSTRRDLATPPAETRRFARESDRLLASFCDAHWLQIGWKFSHATQQRAERRLGANWHRAVPILRIFEVSLGESNREVETWEKDVEIQGGGRVWFVRLERPLNACRVQIGYLAPEASFYPLARSNLAEVSASIGWLEPLRNGVQLETGGDTSTTNWFHFGPEIEFDAEPETVPRKKTDSARTAPGPAPAPFSLRVQVELLVHGVTEPGAHVTFQGSPVTVGANGKFHIQLTQPEGRQVLSLMANSLDGHERRTVVLGVERNTKELEPQHFDGLPPEEDQV